jgi:hypothetical protein
MTVYIYPHKFVKQKYQDNWLASDYSKEAAVDYVFSTTHITDKDLALAESRCESVKESYPEGADLRFVVMGYSPLVALCYKKFAELDVPAVYFVKDELSGELTERKLGEKNE